jgi:alpha-tubulin suppressor-like RCC1 family protein
MLNGTVEAWGSGAHGQVGDGTNKRRKTPVLLLTLANIVNIGSGRDHTLAARSDGTVWAWGANDGGQLGDGSTTDRNAPVQSQGAAGIDLVAAGKDFSLALDS